MTLNHIQIWIKDFICIFRMRDFCIISRAAELWASNVHRRFDAALAQKVMVFCFCFAQRDFRSFTTRWFSSGSSFTFHHKHCRILWNFHQLDKPFIPLQSIIVICRHFSFYLTYLKLYDENVFQNNQITYKIKQEHKQDPNKCQSI